MNFGLGGGSVWKRGFYLSLLVNLALVLVSLYSFTRLDDHTHVASPQAQKSKEMSKFRGKDIFGKPVCHVVPHYPEVPVSLKKFTPSDVFAPLRRLMLEVGSASVLTHVDDLYRRIMEYGREKTKGHFGLMAQLFWVRTMAVRGLGLSIYTTSVTFKPDRPRPRMPWARLAQLGPRVDIEPPDLARTKVWGPGTYKVDAAKQTYFYIQMFRKDGSAYPYPGDWFEVRLVGFHHESLVVPRIQDLYNGTYLATYTVREAGYYTLSVVHTVTQYQDILTPRMRGLIPMYKDLEVGRFKVQVNPTPAAKQLIKDQVKLPLCTWDNDEYAYGRWVPEPKQHASYWNESMLVLYRQGRLYDYRRPPPIHIIDEVLAAEGLTQKKLENLDLMKEHAEKMKKADTSVVFAKPIHAKPLPKRPKSQQGDPKVPAMVWAPWKCRLPWFSHEMWKSCVKRTNIGVVTVMGDSIAGQWFAATKCRYHWPKNMYINDMRKCSWESRPSGAILRTNAIGEIVRFKTSDRVSDWVRHFANEIEFLKEMNITHKRNIIVMNSGSHQCMGQSTDCSYENYDRAIRRCVAFLRDNWKGEVIFRATLAAQRSLIRRERYANILAIQYMFQRRAVELNRIARGIFEQAQAGIFYDPPAPPTSHSEAAAHEGIGTPTGTTRPHKKVVIDRTKGGVKGGGATFYYLDGYDQSLGRPESMMREDVRHPGSELLLNQVNTKLNLLCNDAKGFEFNEDAASNFEDMSQWGAEDTDNGMRF